jgi:hypothetical protein
MSLLAKYKASIRHKTAVTPVHVEPEDHKVLRQPRPCAAQFLAVVLDLVSRGYIVEVRGHHKASLAATVRNQLDLVVGDLQYRDPADEANEYAWGISYAGHTQDQQYAPDLTFQVITAAISR